MIYILHLEFHTHLRCHVVHIILYLIYNNCLSYIYVYHLTSCIHQ